ncbi:MAG: phospholipase A [Maribacter sp.]|nr:phospholipase A [Maribacter sp.]
MKPVVIIYFLCSACFSGFSQTLVHDTGGKLSQRWQIKDDSTKLFKIVPHKPVYFLLANYSSDINNRPSSANPLNEVQDPLSFSNTELKFQLSFKARAITKVFGPKIGGTLWAGYTQSSRWQLYNANISRPFRETNYEPEIMLTIPTSYRFMGLKGVFAGIGINHQSNGRSDPLSRSWNRVVAQFGWENTTWSVVARPWWRVQEEAIEDNNPGIENYLGRVELLTAFSKGSYNVSMEIRHSMRGGERNRGSVTLDYAVKIRDLLQIHVQLFHGYGESLIDYNHKQTTIGLGVSLIQWR